MPRGRAEEQAPRGLAWDVFCRVVDNYGDAAVCWRLAQRLAQAPGARVRLAIDDLRTLRALVPAVDAGAGRQRIGAVEVRRWRDDRVIDDPAEVIVDAFGCTPPARYLARAAAREPRPLWIVLEYMSAEPWVATHHGSPSPHPQLGLPRWFFFPGFDAESGGLLREPDLLARRDAFVADAEARARFWRRHRFAPVEPPALCVSLFGYEQPVLPALLDAWSRSSRPVVCGLTASRIRPGALAWAGRPGAADGETLRAGALELRLLPFVSQADYDELLWACDWNFVRGEDSLVRALWAARPLVWQIYPQAEAAHCVKLDAFLAIASAGTDAAARAAWTGLNRIWSGCPMGDPARSAGTLWDELARLHRASLSDQAARLCARLAARPDLASALAAFCEAKLP